MKNRKLRIFWSSNSTWSTSGYGMAMADLLPLIRDAGYPVGIANFYGQAGGKFEMDGIMQYPVINHIFGSDAMLFHSKDFKADVVFSLQDVWPLNPQDLQHVTRWIPWTPIDHDPMPRNSLAVLRLAHRIIAMSKFGKDQLSQNGFSSTYIPHVVDTEVFKPMDKAEARKKVGFSPNTFIFGMVAANKDNPPRKSFQEVLDAFQQFLTRIPDSLLYIHTDPNFPGGFPIADYARFLGIENRVLFPGMQFPEIYNFKYNTDKKRMNEIYNLFDCLLAPSTSEGFCVPIIEAMSCGVPVITSDWVAMKELVQDGLTGYKVKASSLKWTSMQSYAATPSVDDLLDKMRLLYKADRRAMSRNARKFIVDNFDLKTVFRTKWLPLFETLEKEIYG